MLVMPKQLTPNMLLLTIRELYSSEPPPNKTPQN